MGSSFINWVITGIQMPNFRDRMKALMSSIPVEAIEYNRKDNLEQLQLLELDRRGGFYRSCKTGEVVQAVPIGLERSIVLYFFGAGDVLPDCHIRSEMIELINKGLDVNAAYIDPAKIQRMEKNARRIFYQPMRVLESCRIR